MLDVTLAAVSAIECSFEGATFADRTGILTGAGALLGLLVGAVLVLRRRWPVAVVLVSIAITPAADGLPALPGRPLHPGRLRGAAADHRALAGMNGFGTMLVTFLQFQDNLRDPGSSTSLRMPLALSVAALMALGLTGPPVLLGLYVRARRRLVESLRERADGLERELELLAEKAAERAERARRRGARPDRPRHARRRRAPGEPDGRARRRAQGGRAQGPAEGVGQRGTARRHGAAGAHRAAPDAGGAADGRP